MSWNNVWPMGLRIAPRSPQVNPGPVVLSAAMLNLSGLGVGYLYIRKWALFVFYWMGLGGLSLLAPIHIAWLLVMIFWIMFSVWWAADNADDLCRYGTSIPATARVPENQPLWVFESRWYALRSSRSWRPLFGERHRWSPLLLGVMLVGLTWAVVSFLGVRAYHHLGLADDAHRRGDCVTASSTYHDISSNVVGSFLPVGRVAADRREACLALVEARSLADEERINAAKSAYGTYIDQPSDVALFADGASDELSDLTG